MPVTTVLLFASLRDKVGARSLECELPEETTVGQFKKILVNKHPELAEVMDSLIIAINHEFAFDENSIPKNAEIAIFPPVSGG